MLLLLFLALYFFERSKEPALGDALSFSVAALNGFDISTNATNHFLYINILHLVSWPTGFEGSHLAFQMLSILPAVLCLYMLSKILKILLVKVEIRFLTMLLLGVSFTFWRHAEIIEVYTLNLAFTSFIILWYVKWHKKRDKRYLFQSAFLLGVAMMIHVQQLLYFPFLAYWGYLAFSFKAKYWARYLLSFLVPTSILFVLPIVFETNTIQSVLFDNSFKDEVLDLSAQTILSGTLKSFALLFFNFGPLAILLIIAAFKPAVEKSLHWGLFILGFVVYGFAARYNVSDNHVFFLPAYFVLLIMFGLLVNNFVAKKKSRLLLSYGLAFAVPVFYAMAPSIVSKTSFGDEMNTTKFYKGGAKFFFYPGMRSNNGGLYLGKALNEGTVQQDFNLEIEQNAHKALKYFEFSNHAHD
ncbi:MAG: DUF2723 domain-containing protein [Bacteroidia bacterium]